MVRFLLFSLGIHLLLFWRLSPPHSPTHQLSNNKKKIFFTITPLPPKEDKSKSPQVREVLRKVKRTEHSTNKKKIAKLKNTTSSSSQASSKVSTAYQVKNGLQVVSLPLSYPYQAIKQHQEGTVIIKLTLEKGQITNFIIQQSSGYQTLDRAVITALQQAKLQQNTNQTTTMILAFKFQL